MKLSVLLPERESFNSYSGGAVARWVYETFRSSPDGISFSVIAQSGAIETKYPLPHNYSTWHRLVYSKPLSVIVKCIDNIYPELIWCSVNLPRLKKYPYVLIENRSHYCLYLRKLEYRGNIILHLHNDSLRGVSQLYLEKLDKAVDYVVCCSHAIADSYRHRSPALFKKTRIVYNGVDSTLFFPKNTNSFGRILFVGRIVPEKGVHLLLNAYKRIIVEFPGAELWLAGAAIFGGGKMLTPYEEEVKATIEHINQEGGRIKHHGYVDHDTELPELMRACDVLCLPSTVAEAFPMVVIEAMFSGLYVIATGQGGASEALQGTGTLLSPVNEESVYSALRGYFQMPSSVVKENSNTAFQIASKQFTWDAIRESFYAYLGQLDQNPVD